MKRLAPPALDAARPAHVAQPPPRRGAVGEEARRAVTALLRERAHHLRSAIPARLLGAARLVPALLHASFDQRPLDAEAPGVAGLRYRRRWSSLARAFGLPPPCRAQRGRCLVEAVLGVPTPSGLDVLAVAPPGLSPEEESALQQRLDGVQRVLSQAGAPVRAFLLDPDRLARDGEVRHRAVAFGALLAGRLSPAAWQAIEANGQPLPRLTLSALAANAPGPLATLALTLMTRAPCPTPLEAALALLGKGIAARLLAHPEDFCVRWAGLVPGVGEPLEDVMHLARSQGGPASPDELPRLLERGRALALACTAAIRSSGLGCADRFTQRLWREAIGPEIPRVLLPAIGARLEEEAAAGRLRLDPVRAGRGYEVRLPGGAVLGRGAGPTQARVRALGLLMAADAARPARGSLPAGGSLLAGLDADWRAVGQQLARPRDRPTLLLVVVAGGGARPGPPLDLLNRGPERALEFDGALAVLLVPGRRASARMLAPDEVVRAVLQRAPAGASLEVLAAQSAARPVAARLAQIAGLLRDPSVPAPIAIEAGGRVLVPDGARTRDFPLERFAARPRVFTPDPDAPDISIGMGERRGRSRLAGMVECRVGVVGPRLAALLFADAAGAHLRELVPLAELHERLRDAREIVRAAAPPAILVMRLADDVEAALRRVGPPGTRVEVAVRGALPFIEVEIDGERFGGRSGLGWRDAAEALLARCPPGTECAVGVSAVTATAAGDRPTPLLALYASALARRRLRAYLGRAIATYRTAQAVRNKR